MEQTIIETVGPRIDTPASEQVVESQTSLPAVELVPSDALVQEELVDVAQEKTINRATVGDVARYRHIQADGVYVKMTQMPAGLKLYSKQLPTDHVVILAAGKLVVEVNGKRILFEAPASYVVPANTRVPVVTVTPSAWYCVHVTDETDLNELKKIY